MSVNLPGKGTPVAMRTLVRTIVAGTATTLMMVCALVGILSDSAWAAPSVTMSPANPHNQRTITVSGTGFPVHSKLPTGMQILECADPGGTAAGLPTGNLLCDGSTINPSQINTDAQGSFSAKYTVYSLNGAHTSNIYCDQTHFCVLWVGVDYNNNFFGIHAFSTPFEIGAPGSSSSSSTASGSGIAIWVVIAVVIVVGATVLVMGLRRRQSRSSRLPA
jgi:hypothetical protein